MWPVLLSKTQITGDFSCAAGCLVLVQVELEADAVATLLVWTRSPALTSEAAVAFVGVEAAAWFRAWAGMRIEARDGLLDSSWVVKLKSAGLSRPFGNLTFGSRSSSKKECAQASRGVRRAVGVYSSRRLHSAIASGGVRGRKTRTPEVKCPVPDES